MQLNIKAISFIIGVFCIPYTALAYTAFDNTFGSESGAAPFNYTMLGMNSGDRMDMEYFASESWAGVNGLNVALCRYSGTGTGRIDVEMRVNSTSSAIIASSSLDVSDISGGGGANCGLGTYTNATTSIFLFNPAMHWNASDTVYVSFFLRDSDSGIYFSFRDVLLANVNYYSYLNNLLLFPSGLSKTYGMNISAESFYPAQTTYNASNTPISCETFDIGCYIATSMGVLFVPDQSIVAEFSALTLASSSPFSYVYDVGTIATELNQAGTTTLKFEIPVFGRNVTLFSTGSTTEYIGATNAATLNTMLQMVTALMVVSYVWARSKSLFL